MSVEGRTHTHAEASGLEVAVLAAAKANAHAPGREVVGLPKLSVALGAHTRVEGRLAARGKVTADKAAHTRVWKAGWG